MFNKNQVGEGGNPKDIETVIGASVKVEGNFICQGNIIIDGEIKGQVETANFLRVGVRAIINADVKAGDAIVSGEIHGNMTVNGYLELCETAKIFGDIAASELSIARGAVLNGKCTVHNQPTTVATKKKAARPDNVEDSADQA